MIQEPATGTALLYVTAMTSFVTLVGIIVTGFVQWSASRDARDAARDARDAAKGAASMAQEAKATNDKIEVLVNNKSDVQATLIKEAKEEIAKLNAQLLAKAEASPATGAPAPIAATIPVKVVVVDTEKPIDVIDKTPTKGELP